jgi:hypothetical protein
MASSLGGNTRRQHSIQYQDRRSAAATALDSTGTAAKRPANLQIASQEESAMPQEEEQ